MAKANVAKVSAALHSHHYPHNDHGAGHRIGLAFFLNLGFTIIEFIGGALTQSTAIMADAVHDLGDTIALGSAWVLNKVSQRDASPRFTYGYQRLTLIGALLNAMVLLVGSAIMLWHAIPRFWEPVMPQAEGMIWLALLGIAVNGYATLKMRHGHSMNERVLSWHLLEDVLGWVAVLIVAIALLFVDWPWLDPLLAVAFTSLILVNVVRNLVTTLKLFAQASPDPVLYQQLADTLMALPQVANVHHLHLWSLDGERHVLTTHIEMAEHYNAEQQLLLKQQLATALKPFDLAHTTLELEAPQEVCRDESTHIDLQAHSEPS